VNSVSWLLVGFAVAAAAVAVQAGDNLTLAVPAAAGAVLLVSVAGALEVQARSFRLAAAPRGVIRQAHHERVEFDSLLRLRRAFTSGTIGRSAILATIRALERDLSPAGPTLLSLEEERTILNLPPKQFRSWIDGRLRRIETAT
jgi:hypothetical protein